MGLDITVYTKIEPWSGMRPAHELNDGDDWDWMYDNGIVDTDVNSKIFLASRRGLPDSRFVKSTGDTWGFRAGSYGGYSRFRENLAALAVNVPPAAIWDDDDKYVDTPFFELINFSDAEGYIGCEAAADLAADFDSYYEQAKVTLDEWDFSSYEEWQKAFHDASDGGMVAFH